jgi:hypothetical protein
MWSKVQTLFLILSLSLNIAFVGVWLGPVLLTRISRPDYGRGVKADNLIWCPLHQKLGISEGQWRQIEPLLTAFQAKAREQRQKIMGLRMQMIDLIKSPQVSHEAIRAKKNEIRSAQDNMKAMVIEYLLAEKEILSKEQQVKFFEMIQAECKQAGIPPLIGSPDECVTKRK